MLEKGKLFQPGRAFPSRMHALTAIAEDCEVRGTRFKILPGKNGLHGNALMVVCAKPQAKHKVKEEMEKPSVGVGSDGEVKGKSKKGFVQLTYNERMDRVGSIVKQHHWGVSRGDHCSYLVTLVRSGSVTGKLRASAFTMGQAGSADNPVPLDMEDETTEEIQATVESYQPPAAEHQLMGLLKMLTRRVNPKRRPSRYRRQLKRTMHLQRLRVTKMTMHGFLLSRRYGWETRLVGGGATSWSRRCGIATGVVAGEQTW